MLVSFPPFKPKFGFCFSFFSSHTILCHKNANGPTSRNIEKVQEKTKDSLENLIFNFLNVLVHVILNITFFNFFTGLSRIK